MLFAFLTGMLVFATGASVPSYAAQNSDSSKKVDSKAASKADAEQTGKKAEEFNNTAPAAGFPGMQDLIELSDPNAVSTGGKAHDKSVFAVTAKTTKLSKPLMKRRLHPIPNGKTKPSILSSSPTNWKGKTTISLLKIWPWTWLRSPARRHLPSRA